MIASVRSAVGGMTFSFDMIFQNEKLLISMMWSLTFQFDFFSPLDNVSTQTVMLFLSEYWSFLFQLKYIKSYLHPPDLLSCQSL